MIYVTGDTHGRFGRLQPGLYGQPQLQPEDSLIICGDFGGIWQGNAAENAQLDELAALPYTILFADGNHENYDLLEAYPVTIWNGGKVQFIRQNVIHLMRGQIYTIEGKTIFVMGGAASHDIQHGILDPKEPGFERRYRIMRATGKFFRVRGMSWWEHELPDREELEEARKNLSVQNWKVDAIITHCATANIQFALELTGHGSYPTNRLTDFFDELMDRCSFRVWYCGHYHRNSEMGIIRILYEKTVPLFPEEG